MSRTIEVPVRFDQSYNVTVGTGLWDTITQYLGDRFPRRLGVVVIDENVQGLHGDKIEKHLDPVFDQMAWYEVPEGEKSKNPVEWNKLVDFLLKQDVERDTPLLAVGGGVTGDLAGFAASAALRGLPLVHLPTSLLAMVDSSIGGKTGVNHDLGKNLIGSFYQPDAVFSDLDFLKTLENEEWVNGLSEVIKYAAIDDPALFDEVESLAAGGRAFEPGSRWLSLIGKSSEIKADIVSRDTLEGGIRAYLNFGHTFGHALEKISGYGTVSHGEAVFVGMIAAAHASEALGHPVSPKRFDTFKPLYTLELEAMANRIDELVDAMRMDKKVRSDRIRLVLVRDWGDPFIRECEDDNLIKEAWSYALSQVC